MLEQVLVPKGGEFLRVFLQEGTDAAVVTAKCLICTQIRDKQAPSDLGQV